MERDAKVMRQDGPTLFTQAKHMVGLQDIADHLLRASAEIVPASSW